MKKFTHAQLLNLPFLLFFMLNMSFTCPLQTDNCLITFFINDVLENASPSSLPVTDNIGLLPFSEPKENVHGWLPFLTSVQALESGNLIVIAEELMGTQVQGIYVTSSEGDNSRMVAMSAVFGSANLADSLRFFGELRPGLSESHIAVVGGTGRYHGANGFAVVKAAGQEAGVGKRKKKLVFTVYIK